MNNSSSSGSSSVRWHNREKGRVAGIPKSCWCGAGIVEKISGTEENPFRCYFRCSFAYSHKLRNDPHVFKWVDEAFNNEITQLDYQVSVLEEEMELLKQRSSTWTDEEGLIEYKMSILRDVENMMNENNWKMKRMMAVVFVACLVVVVLVIVMKK